MPEEARSVPFGAWLRGRRAEKRQTQEEAASELGLSVDLVARWEREQRLPVKVADVLALEAWAEVERGTVFELVARALEATSTAA